MKFEDLETWKQARQLVREIYTLCRDNPLSKDFGLRDQPQRAAVSGMTNIAEGFERSGLQEKLQFYNFARASCGEVRSLLYVVEDNFPNLSRKSSNSRITCSKVGALISGLIASTEKRRP
jgi:four helix bundle protein